MAGQIVKLAKFLFSHCNLGSLEKNTHIDMEWSWGKAQEQENAPKVL